MSGARDDAAAWEAKAPAHPKIFISYSRRDQVFTDDLCAALKKRGFNPTIDRSDIYALEDWWQRIQALIVQADTIVFVLSPDGIASKVCAQEVEFAAGLNKRLAPVVCRPVEDALVPEQLRKINYISFADGASFEASADLLAEALSTDIDWVRKHTEFGSQAMKWEQAGRPGPQGLLLRSPVLEEAERWIASRPADAPMPTAATLAFITESRTAATRRRNYLTASLAGGLLVALVLAGVAFWQRAVANEQRAAATEQRDRALVTQSRYLADLSSQRLASGDVASAVDFALEALPDERHGVVRPLVKEAMAALAESWRRLRESEVVRVPQTWAERRELLVAFERHAVSADHAFGVTPQSGEQDQDHKAVVYALNRPNEPEIVATLTGHTKRVNAASMSPGGLRAVTASEDTTARIWDAKTGAALLELAHQRPVLYAEFSPDGRSVVTVTSEEVKIWDSESGAPIDTYGHQSSATVAVFSPDGKQLAIGSASDVRIWPVGDTMRIYSPIVLPGRARFIQYSTDGHRLLVIGEKVTVWSSADGAHKWRPAFTTMLKLGDTIGFRSNDSITRVDRSTDTLRTWKLDDPHPPLSLPLPRPEDSPRVVAYDRTGTQAVVATAANWVRIWNASTRTLKTLDGNVGYGRFEFSPDGKRLAGISYSTLTLWDTTGGNVLLSEKDIRGASFSADAGRLLAISSKGDVVVHDAGDGRTVARFDHQQGVARRAWFLAGGDKVALGLDKAGLALWQPATGAVSRVQFPGLDVTDVVGLSPDGRRIVARIGEDWRRALVLDLESKKQLAVLGSPVDTAAIFSPDGKRIASSSAGAPAYLWDSETGRRLVGLPVRQVDSNQASFSSNWDRMAYFTGDDEKIVKVMDLQTGGTVDTLVHSERVFGVAFAPDGKSVLTASAEGALVWSLPTEAEMIDLARKEVPRCLESRVREAAFLDPAPPLWCIEQSKWPYDEAKWKDGAARPSAKSD
jgi:WD40 repeat protein